MEPHKNVLDNWCRNCPICQKIIEYGKDKNAKYYSKTAHIKQIKCSSCHMKMRVWRYNVNSKIWKNILEGD